MRFLHSYRLSLTNPFVVLWFMIWYRTPDQSKRLCVLASLYARLLQCGVDDVALLKQLNREFGLSRDCQALRFPALLAPLIWRNILPIQRISLDNEEHYIARLVKKTPCWLWYADAETRHEDIRKLVELCVGKAHRTA